MQILLRGKAAQLRIVVAHLVVHRFHQVPQGDDAENAVGGIQHGNGAFRVAFQPLDTVLRALAAVDIREPVLDKGRDSRVLFRNKQSAQLHRAAEKPFSAVTKSIWILSFSFAWSISARVAWPTVISESSEMKLALILLPISSSSNDTSSSIFSEALR